MAAEPGPSAGGNVESSSSYLKYLQQCLICDDELTSENSTTLGTKATENFVKASKLRKDGKFKILSSLPQLRLHNNCRTVYIRPQSINTAVNKLKKKRLENRNLKKETNAFNFDEACFICNKSRVRNAVKTYVSNIETVNKMIRELESRTLNDEEKYVLLRLSVLKDKLNDVKAFYHKDCHINLYRGSSKKSVGRPILDDTSKAVTFVIDHILENEDECQFSLTEILKSYDGDVPKFRSVKEHLISHFGNQINCNFFRGDLRITYINDEMEIDDKWYEARTNNSEEERMRVCEAAAHIMLQDARKLHYDLSYYKSPITFMNNLESDVPPTILKVLEILIASQKRGTSADSNKKWKNRVLTVAHIIMSSIRPNSFLSSILLGLSSMIHRKHASKGLITCLANLGLCASYHETLLFEASIVKHPENYVVSPNSFVQYIFDNADHNTCTIDGRNTFHAMGGIAGVTPASAVVANSNIPRLHKIPPADSLCESVGFLPLQNLKISLTGFESIVVEKIDILQNYDGLSAIDFLWLFAKKTSPKNTKGWLGYKEAYSPVTEFSVSKIIPLPFVNAPPSEYDTILTVLIESAKRARVYEQNYAFVTFDQPLYWKARSIIASIDRENDVHNIKIVILRLGGFHTLMSFLGAVGHIMEGSGLQEAFNLLYAENSAAKALTGHAFSRSIRGHILNLVCIGGLIIDHCDFNEVEITYLNNLTARSDLKEIDFCNDLSFVEILNKFKTKLHLLRSNGPTAQLWIQYFECIVIVLNFYHAERSGDFKLHLSSMSEMLPYFHASGHHNYAKSAHLYLQDMTQLQSVLSLQDYDQFANEGFFTIRRSCKYWSGVWSDMAIEQVLMRAMKCVGGLTRGRGMSESTVSKWIACTILLLEISHEMEQFCNYVYENTEQHVDSRTSRVDRDASDLHLLIDFYAQYNPFVVSDKLYSIYSGLVGNNKINCHEAHEVGIKLIDKIIGTSYDKVSFQRKYKVLPLSTMNSKLKINNDIVTIQPLLVFQRICLNVSAKSDMRQYLHFELAPFPLSLFHDGVMRKTDKSSFCENFNSTPECPFEPPIIFIVDGGFLLHQITWKINESVSQILQFYINYVNKNFCKNSVIIFDGYDVSGTKSAERLRRQNGCIGREIKFDCSTKINLKANEFFGNEKNKSNFIKLLSTKLNESGYRTKTADEDADFLIIKTAIETSKYESNVVIVGNDTDLLVLFTQLAENNPNIVFKKVTPDRKKNIMYYTSNSFKCKELCEIITFLYAFTGCDTTSCFFNKGKNSILKCIPSDKLLHFGKVFYDESANCETICKAGYDVIKGLYATKLDIKYESKTNNLMSLNDLRFLQFERSTIKSNFKLESLPPTLGAAKQHSLRVYLQIQAWQGNYLNPTEFGWIANSEGFNPNFSEGDLIPEDILKKISCKCTTGCGKKCGCRKHGLKCTRLCTNCQGESCENAETEQSKAEAGEILDEIGVDKYSNYIDDIGVEEDSNNIDDRSFLSDSETSVIDALHPQKKAKFY